MRLDRTVLDRHRFAMARMTESMKKRRKSGDGNPPWISASELAADLMFAGPGDLSSNPKYMEGYGQPNEVLRATRPQR